MIFVEHVKDNYDHLDVNVALVASFVLNTNKEEKHYFFAGEKHFINIKNSLLNKLSIQNMLINKQIKPYNSVVRDYKYIFSDFNIVLKTFIFSKRNKINEICFLNTTTFLLYYIKLFLLFSPKIKVYCVIHGDLERINLKQYSNSFDKNKTLMYLYAMFFGLLFPLKIYTPKNLKYLILGESIKQNLMQILPKIKDNVIAIPHPILWEDNKNLNSNLNFEKIKFVLPGIIAPRKNQKTLEKLIEDLHKESLKQKFDISFAGKILSFDFFQKMHKYDFINKSSLNTKMLDIKDRNFLIYNATYSIYTYTLNSYKLIASGAFLDSINFNKPMIAIKNDYINYYFEKYGNIGYLCSSYNELKEKIFDLINNFPEKEYFEQVKNIQQIKKNESIDKISLILKKEAEK